MAGSGSQNCNTEQKYTLSGESQGGSCHRPTGPDPGSGAVVVKETCGWEQVFGPLPIKMQNLNLRA